MLEQLLADPVYESLTDQILYLIIDGEFYINDKGENVLTTQVEIEGLEERINLYVEAQYPEIKGYIYGGVNK